MDHVTSSVFPVFALIALGAVLRRRGWTDERFCATSDRLVYFIFFPTMLFWKIGNPQTADAVSWKAALAALSAVLVVYGASLAYVLLSKMPAVKVGTFSQNCYRFNTYVGMAVVLGTLGEEGVRHFAVIISVSIPVVNVLAVSTLIWFSRGRASEHFSAALLLRSLFSNPLILACLAGLLYARLAVPFPLFIDNTFRLMAWVSLPLALLSIGGALTFEKLKDHYRLALAACGFKLIVLPAVGYGFLRLYGVEPLPSAVAMLFFALPPSTAIYILSSQLHSDVDLASASIVLSTMLSLASVSFVVSRFVG